MKNKIVVVCLAIAGIIFTLPTEAGAKPAENNRPVYDAEFANHVAAGLMQPRGRRWRRGNRSGRWYGYKNYGQYRRSRVGNRRYRLVRRSFWRDGIRSYRWIRIYY